jgi:hypothetical protein
MKNVFTALCLVLILSAISSCTEEVRKKLLPSFNVDVPGIKLSIPPIKFVSEKELPIGSLKTPLNLDSTIKANTHGTFGANSVTSVKVKQIIIKLLNADQKNNLSNFESARMKIYNDTSEAQILNLHFPTNYTDSISVTPANHPEISTFLKGSSLSYNLYWKNRSTTSKYLKLKVDITFSVQ